VLNRLAGALGVDWDRLLDSPPEQAAASCVATGAWKIGRPAYWRKLAELSQAQLAERARIERETLVRIERRPARPR
jgi:hypothetical protein